MVVWFGVFFFVHEVFVTSIEGGKKVSHEKCLTKAEKKKSLRSLLQSPEGKTRIFGRHLHRFQGEPMIRHVCVRLRGPVKQIFGHINPHRKPIKLSP